MINVSGAPPNGIIIPPPPPYYDNYSGPANPACFLTMDHLNDWAGQSFTTSQKYNFWRADLWIKKGPGSAVGDFQVELWAVDGNGHPTGTKLNSGVIPNADVAENYAWVRCILDVARLTPYIVSANTKYCVVVHGSGFTAIHYLKWACGGDGSDYPNGDQEWSTDGGNIWTTDNTRDQLFRCYPAPWLDNYSGTLLGGGVSTCNSANDWAGNSFTAMKSYTLNRIDMYVQKDVGMDVGNVTVVLYNVDGGTGYPIGAPLTSGLIPNADFSEGVLSWTRCDVSDFNIVLGTKYAALIHGVSLNPANLIRVMWDNKLGLSDFAGGDMLWSMTGGASWFLYDTKDHLFRCYGSE